MRKKILFAFIAINFQLFFAFHTLAQNIGIGTPSPVFKLDVRNGSINTDSVYRIGTNTVLSVKGISNTFVGVDCGSRLNENSFLGRNNTALGHSALHFDTSGHHNTAIGESALYSNIRGIENTACGAEALYNNDADYNCALGNGALGSNTSGTENVACGVQASLHNVAGNDNTAIGNYTLISTLNSDGNTAVGYTAGGSFNNGFYNTFLGIDANATESGYFNSVALGGGSRITAQLQVRIGNTLINSIGGYQDWSNISDGRYKQNVKEDVKGLEFIMRLRPVTYNLNIPAIRDKLNENRFLKMEYMVKDAIIAREQEIHSGFIAQEVEKAANEVGYDFSGVDKPNNENDFYGLRYGEFVVPLVKAVQEQQQQIDSLSRVFLLRQGEFNDLKKRIEVLEQTLSQFNLKSVLNLTR